MEVHSLHTSRVVILESLELDVAAVQVLTLRVFCHVGSKTMLQPMCNLLSLSKDTQYVASCQCSNVILCPAALDELGKLWLAKLCSDLRDKGTLTHLPGHVGLSRCRQSLIQFRRCNQQSYRPAHFSLLVFLAMYSISSAISLMPTLSGSAETNTGKKLTITTPLFLPLP